QPKGDLRLLFRPKSKNPGNPEGRVVHRFRSDSSRVRDAGLGETTVREAGVGRPTVRRAKTSARPGVQTIRSDSTAPGLSRSADLAYTQGPKGYRCRVRDKFNTRQTCLTAQTWREVGDDR